MRPSGSSVSASLVVGGAILFGEELAALADSFEVDICLIDAADAAAKLLLGSQSIALFGRDPILGPKVRAPDLDGFLVGPAGPLLARHTQRVRRDSAPFACAV